LHDEQIVLNCAYLFSSWARHFFFSLTRTALDKILKGPTTFTRKALDVTFNWVSRNEPLLWIVVGVPGPTD